MPACERLLVHTNALDDLSLAACQTTCHGPLLNGVHLVPAQDQLIGNRFLARHFHPVDGEPLKQGREAARRLGPRKLHVARSVFRAVGPRRRSVQNRAVLAGIQMPPESHRLMIVKRAVPAAFRAWPSKTFVVPQVHVHLALAQLQVDAFHAPRLSDNRIWAYRSRSCTCPLSPPPTKMPDERLLGHSQV